jgi:hypothetical protein
MNLTAAFYSRPCFGAWRGQLHNGEKHLSCLGSLLFSSGRGGQIAIIAGVYLLIKSGLETMDKPRKARNLKPLARV